MGVNFKAMVNIIQVAAKGMIDSGNGGSIVNMASIVCWNTKHFWSGSAFCNKLKFLQKFQAGHLTCAGIGAYSCSKAAVLMLTKSCAHELGKHKIRVNAVRICGIWVRSEIALLVIAGLPNRRWNRDGFEASRVCRGRDWEGRWPAALDPGWGRGHGRVPPQP